MIEESLNQLTAAVNALTNALLAQPMPTVTATVAPDSDNLTPPVEEPKKRVRRTQAQIAADQAALEAGKANPDAPTVTLQSLRIKAQKILDAGHPDKIREINTSLGVSRLSEAAPEQYAQLDTLLTKALDGLGPI